MIGFERSKGKCRETGKHFSSFGKRDCMILRFEQITKSVLS